MTRHLENAAATIRSTVRLQRTPTEPGTIDVEIDFSIPDSVTLLESRITAPVRSVSTDGFEYDRTTSMFVWDDGPSTPSIEFSLSENRPGDGHVNGFHLLDSGDWALVETPVLPYSITYRGTEPVYRSSVEVVGDGTASDDGHVAYLGDHETYQASVHGQRIRLIVPDAATLTAAPDVILGSLLAMASALEVGHRDEDVVAIAAPGGPVERSVGGRQSGESGFWVKDDAALETGNNSWLHEYVHTRQGFTTAPDTQWLVEGTADFYAALYAWRQGHLAFDGFYETITDASDSTGVLADPDRWESRFTPYRNGRRVIGALDAKIRADTDGASSFTDVFRELNAVDEDLSHAHLTHLLEQVTGLGLGGWLDTYVRTTAVPPVPRDGSIWTIPAGAPARCSTCDRPVPASVERCAACLDATGSEGRDPVAPTHSAPTGDDSDSGADAGRRPDEPDNPEADADSDSDSEVAGGETGSSGDRVCPICQTERESTERFCPECGHDFGERLQPRTDTEADPKDTDAATRAKCSLCETPLSADVAYCPACGTKQKPVCPVCDFKHEPGSEFCPGCGQQL